MRGIGFFKFFFFIICLLSIAGSGNSAGGADPVDFPDMAPNADIRLLPSAFGPQRLNVIGYGTGEAGSVEDYRLLTRCYGPSGEEPLFEAGKSQPAPEFDLFMKAWEGCDVMIAGYDGEEKAVMATPVATVDSSRFTREGPRNPEAAGIQSRSRDGYFIDASQYPLIRIRGEMPTAPLTRSGDASALALPEVEENASESSVKAFTAATDRIPTDILLLVDNSASMAYQSPWFLPKLDRFLSELEKSGAAYRIGLVPFGSPEEIAANLKNTDLFTGRADEVLSETERRLTFSAVYDDAADALERAIDLPAWNEEARKVILLAANEPLNTDPATEERLVNAAQNKSIRIFAFLPEQSRSVRRLTRRTGGGFHHFDNEDLADALPDILPSPSAFSLAYESDPSGGFSPRQVALRFPREISGTRTLSPQIPLSYTPPAPFELMRLPRTAALDEDSQKRRAEMAIEIKVLKQDPAIADPAVTLHYQDSREESYKTLLMTETAEDIYTAVIPADEMGVFGINYYVSAALDGETRTLPARHPETQPFSVAVYPNLRPGYSLPEKPTLPVPGKAYTIEATLYDDTQQVVWGTLYYRKAGDTDYTMVQQASGRTETAFSAAVPAEAVTAEGLEYYIAITDDKGVVTYVGSMDQPMKALPADARVENSGAARATPDIQGSGFYVWANSVTRDPINNDYLASGNVYIGKTMDFKILGYKNGTLRVASDRKTFRSEDNQGTLFANEVRRRINSNQLMYPEIFKGNFQRNPDDDNAQFDNLTIKLELTPASEKILWYDEDNLLALKSRITSASLIEVHPEKVVLTGSKVDFALKNPNLSFFDFGGVSSVETSIWSRNDQETTSKQTFGIQAGRMGNYDLLDISVTLDGINLGLEISAGGLAFGVVTQAATNKIFEYSAKKFPKLQDSKASIPNLNGFTIGAQLKPPGITRFTANLDIPPDISSQLTIPHVSYSKIPFGIAPKNVGIDIKNLIYEIPPSLSASITGSVYDNGNVMATLEKILGTALLSGQLVGNLDLSGTVSLGGKATTLYWDMAKFYGHFSRYAPQIKMNGSIILEASPLAAIQTDLGLDGYISGDTVGFAGRGNLTVTPPVLIAGIMECLGLCNNPKCSFAGIHASVTGSASNTTLNIFPWMEPIQVPSFSLKAYAEAYFTYPVCFFVCWEGTYKLWASVTLLPKFGVDYGGAIQRSYQSAPGVHRELTEVQLENGETATALIEFHYGRPVAAIQSSMRSPVNPYTVRLPAENKYATLIVKGETGIPQVEVTLPPIENETPPIYNSTQHTAVNEKDLVTFNSENSINATVGIIKHAPAGDYLIDVKNPAEIGNYTIEMSVPHLQPQFAITSAQVVEETATQKIVEITYDFDDPDSEKPYVTFRLDDAKGSDDPETALYLFPENANSSNFENAKLYGKGTGKTVRLVVESSKLKAAAYKLYGRAEDGITNPVVQWTDLELTLMAEGVPNPPQNVATSVSGSGVLLEWDPRPVEEKVGAYSIWIENANDPEQWYDIWVEPEIYGTAYEIAGLQNDVTYRIELYSVNTETFEYSFPAVTTVTPTGQTSSGSPDLMIVSEETEVTRDDWNNEVSMVITIKNVGTAPSSDAIIEIFYGKMNPDFAVVDERDGDFAKIDPLIPGASVTYDFIIPAELLDILTMDTEYAADYPCIFRIIKTEPKELNTDNNTGMVEKITDIRAVERQMTLHAGWNLVALPVDTFASAALDAEAPLNTYRHLFGEVSIWQYYEGEWLSYGPHIDETAYNYLDYVFSDEGFWVYSPVEKTIRMTDGAYQTRPEWLSEDTWSLMGTGDPIDDPLAYFKAEDPEVAAIWIYQNDQWVRDPARIEVGRGFWVSRSATENPPEKPEASEMANAILILKLLTGIDLEGYPMDTLDVNTDGAVDMKDALYALQLIAGLR